MKLIHALPAFIASVVMQFNSFTQINHIGIVGNTADLKFAQVDETTGVCIVGGSSKVYKSSDNGVNWTACANVSGSFLSAVIVNPTTYVLVGDYASNFGRILQTSNSGVTWSMSVNSHSKMFTDVAQNGQHIIAVGFDGTIFSSLNNGLSWTNHTIATTADFKTVVWHPVQNKWIIGGTNIRLETSDITGQSGWVQQALTETISDLSFNNGMLTETSANSTNTFIKKSDASGALVSQNIIPTIGFGLSRVLPDSNILTVQNNRFFVVESPDNLVFLTTDSIHSNSSSYPANIKDIAFGDTYGIAVGQSGAIGKFSLSMTYDHIVLSSFTMNTGQYDFCSENFVEAYPDFLYADGYAWYWDNVLISAEDTLNFQIPVTQGYHELKLITNKNGLFHETIEGIPIVYLPAFPTYEVSVDTMICFQSPVIFELDYQSGSTSGFQVQVFKGGQAFGPIYNASTSQNVLIESSIMSLDDTLELRFSYTNVCGTQIQSYFYPITVEVDLATTYTLISADSGICIENSNFTLILESTLVGVNHFIEIERELGGSVFPNVSMLPIHYSQPGIGTSQINVNDVAVGYAFAVLDTEQDNKVFLTVERNGCSASNIHLSDFVVSNPKANFVMDRLVIGLNDTVEMTHSYPSDSVHWAITPNAGVSENLQDSVPLLIPGEIGKYNVFLHNESRFGCLDSMSTNLYVADTLAVYSGSVCFKTDLDHFKIVGTKTDHSNNLYEYGYSADNNFSNLYFRKISSTGDLLWSKMSGVNYAFDGNKVYISDLEIDDSNNIYAMISVLANQSDFDFELIHQPMANHTYYSYLAKFDSLGNMLNYHSLGHSNNFSGLELTNDYIVATGSGYIITFDYNYNTVNYTELTSIYAYGIGPGYANNFNLLTNWSYHPLYPKIKAMPNGNIAFVSDMGAEFMTGDSTFGNAPFVPENFIYVAIYNPLDGFIDSKKIMEVALREFSVPITGDITVDESNNIYVTVHKYSDFYGYDYYINDTMYYKNDDRLFGNFLFKLDPDLHIEWVRGNSGYATSLSYSFATKQLYMAVNLYSDLYANDATKFYLFEHTSGSEGILLYSKEGVPVSGMNFGPKSIYGNLINPILALSHCGDVYLSLDNQNILHTTNTASLPYNFNLDGQAYSTTSNCTFKLSLNNCTDECSFIVLEESFNHSTCAMASGSYIPVYSQYGVDSVFFEAFVQGVLQSSGYFQSDDQFVYADYSNPSLNYYIVLHGILNGNGTDTIYFTNNTGIEILPQEIYSVTCESDLEIEVPAQYTQMVYTLENGQQIYGELMDSLSLFLVPGDTMNITLDALFNGCPISQQIQVVTCTDLSVSENGFSSWKVYPIPSKNELFIEPISNFASGFLLTLHDLSGRKILSQTIPGNQKYILQMDGLDSGLYLLNLSSIENGEIVYTFQVVKI